MHTSTLTIDTRGEGKGRLGGKRDDDFCLGLLWTFIKPCRWLSVTDCICRGL